MLRRVERLDLGIVRLVGRVAGVGEHVAITRGGNGLERTPRTEQRDLGRVASDRRAMLIEDGVLAGDRLRRPEDVAGVRVLGDEPERPVFAAGGDRFFYGPNTFAWFEARRDGERVVVLGGHGDAGAFTGSSPAVGDVLATRTKVRVSTASRRAGVAVGGRWAAPMA